MSRLISVLIPTVRGNTLQTAIDAVLRQSHRDLELVVIAQGDDARLHEVLDRAARSDSRVRPVKINEFGASRARNEGIRRSTGDIIAMTDDDCEPAADWLEVIDGCFAREPDVGVVGGALLAPKPDRRGPYTCPTNTPSESLYDPSVTGTIAPPGWDWFTANVAVRRSAADLVGPFDESLGPGAPFRGWDDPDWKIRLADLGVKMRVTPRSVVHHTHGIRYGVGEILRHLKNYANGAGGFAGKLAMKGDPRGAELYRISLENARRADRALPANLLRWHHFRGAYERCLREYRMVEGSPVLQRRPSATA